MGKKTKTKQRTAAASKKNSAASADPLAVKEAKYDPILVTQFVRETLETNATAQQENILALQRHDESILEPGGSWGTLWRPLRLGTDQHLSCLGVPPVKIPGFVNLFSTVEGSIYAKLPRPALLPGKCPIQLDHPASQEAVMKFWDGNFKVAFYDPSKDGADKMLCHPRIEDKDVHTLLAETSDPNYHLSFGIKLETDFMLDGEWKIPVHRKLHMTAALIQQMSFDERELLESRILHHFLRQYGWILSDRVLQSMWTCAAMAIRGRKKYAATFLDLCLLQSDILLNLPYKQRIGLQIMGAGICRIGEALEATKTETGGHYFLEAASLYWEAVERFLPQDGVADTEILKRVAKNLRQADRRQEGMEYMLKCLRACGSELANFQTDKINHVLSELVIHQSEMDLWLGQLRVGKGKYKRNDDEKVFDGLRALLLAARFQSHQEEVDTFLREFPRVHTPLQKHLTKPKKAKQALLQIIQTSSDLEEYKRGILATQRSVSLWFYPPSPPNPSAQKNRQKEAQKAARTFVKLQGKRLQQFCGGCGKRELEERFATCGRCKIEAYCSNDCQRADWQEHKYYCQTVVGDVSNLESEGL